MKTVLTCFLIGFSTAVAASVPLQPPAADGTGYLAEINFTREDSPDLALPGNASNDRYFEFIPIHPVYFEHDEDMLDSSARSRLDDAAMLIRNLPGVTRVIIKGYTDVVAGEPYNNALSDRRAAAVREYLIDRGIAEHLLHTSGYGKAVPVDVEWTRYGRSRNRRVEIFVVRQFGNGTHP